MTKNPGFFLLLLLLLTGCCRKGSIFPAGYRPRTGDLLFVVAADSGFSQAIVQATAHHEPIKFSHVAILTVEKDTPYVLEASSRHDGVALVPWNDFLANAPVLGGKPGIVVKRVETDFPVNEAISRARAHIGESYDWHFLPDNGMMYCSELVYESFRDAGGKPLFTARPMRFRDADGQMPAFWTELFDKLGEPVPEGQLGTNPNDMAKETILREIWRFF